MARGDHGSRRCFGKVALFCVFLWLCPHWFSEGCRGKPAVVLASPAGGIPGISSEMGF